MSLRKAIGCAALLAAAAITPVSANAGIIQKDPEPTVKSWEMKEDSLLLMSDNENTAELVTRMDDEEYPEWCQVEFPEDKLYSGAMWDYGIVDIYNKLAGISLKENPDSVSDDRYCRVTFFYDDIGDVTFDFLGYTYIEDTYIYDVIDEEGFFEYAQGLYDEQENIMMEWEGMEGVVFRATDMNTAETDAGDNHWLSTEYIITEDGKGYFLEKRFITGYREAEELLLEKDSIDTLKDLLKKGVSAYGKEDHSYTDGEEWKMSLYDEEGEETDTFFGSVNGKSDLEKIVKELRNSVPFIVY